MRIQRTLVQLALVAIMVAAPSVADGASQPITATGGGWFLYAGTIPMQFGFSAVARSDGTARGLFHHFYVAAAFSYAFWGALTCAPFDPVNHRAWIGGVLTKVSSTDPGVGVAPGDDAWF